MLGAVCALVTKPQPQADELATHIHQVGGKTIIYPTFSIEDPLNVAVLQKQIETLSSVDIAIFISPHAVKKTMPYWQTYWPELPKHLSIAAVGKSTQETLQQFGYTKVIYPKTTFNSEALLALPNLQTVQNKTIMIFQGETGRGLLQEVLTQRGATVITAIAYRRVLPSPIHEPTLLEWKKKGLNYVIYTNAEGMLNLFQLVDAKYHPWLKSIPSLVISARLKEIAKTIGIQHVIETKNARTDMIIETLIKENNHGNS